MAELDDLEILLRKAERDTAQDDAVRLRALLEEVRTALRAPGSADDKVRFLIDRLAV